MIFSKLKDKQKQPIRLCSGQVGFTMIETLIYLFILSMLMLLISSLVMGVFNAKKQLQASNSVHNNARFIVNFLSNKIHNVDLIVDANPAVEQLHFYIMPDTRFSVAIESGDLIFREVEDTGAGFPDQSTAEPVALNNSRVRVSNLVLTPIVDSQGNQNQGVAIDFIITAGSASDIYGYLQKDFSTFISIR